MAPARAASLLVTSLLATSMLAGNLQAAELPAAARDAMQRARIAESALSVLVQEAGSGRTLLASNERVAVNPASLMKLLTTYAALDSLGPAWSWATPVYFGGPLRDGVLEGPLVIKGAGDPKLVIERLWLLLRRVQQLGVTEIRGDIVLDRSAFAAADGAATDFDGDATRPYNVLPDPLLLNFKSVIYSFVPDPARGVARVMAEPDLGPGRAERTVPLNAGPCDDWRGALKAVAGDKGYRFAGSYPQACGEQTWPLADPNPATYNARFIETIWRELGGRLSGVVRDGPVPAGARLAFEYRSPPLAETVRDINKFSNNVMAQQLALSLALHRAGTAPQRGGVGSGVGSGVSAGVGAGVGSVVGSGVSAGVTAEAARDTLRRWVAERLGEPPAEIVIDSGSGLSRQNRVTAAWLGVLLQHAYSSPVMPELMSSLPVTGLDGTLRRSRAAPGRAHLKTGSLREVAGVAGYVLADSGQRYVLVAIVNHANAAQARPAIDELVQWVMRDGPAATAGLPPPTPHLATRQPPALKKP